MPSLKLALRSGKPRVFPVFKRMTTIGREEACDIVITEPGIAPLHATLLFDGREFTMQEDDGAILVDGKRKKRIKVFHNDRFHLGEAELTFSVYDESSSVEAPRGDNPELLGMRRLADFNRRLLEIRDVHDQLRTLLDATIELTDAAKGFVILLKDGVPHISAARNIGGVDLDNATAQLSDSIVARVIATEAPLIVSDALHDTVFASSQSVMSLQLCSVMCAPLIAQGQLLGILYVGNDNVVSLFEQQSLDILTILAGQASLIVQNALLFNQVSFDKQKIESQLSGQNFTEIVGSCAPIVELSQQVRKIAPTEVNVLITGETGTGKELIAREVHRQSRRSSGPFVVVNCGAIPENLMESELFGHVRGAFTGAVANRQGSFQQANTGTLFLDEVGEMPLALQVKLLRALQERVVRKVGGNGDEDVDIRVVAATNRDLAVEVAEGRFREDLYYRLNVVNIHMPPLRDRGQDIVAIARYVLHKHAAEAASPVRGFTPGAVEAMLRYSWPGNIRQLENRIRKALVLADRPLLGPDDLDLSAQQPILEIQPLSEAREEFTKRYILEVLERNHGNRTQTARDLGVDPRTIFRYLEREPDLPEPNQ